VCMIITYACGLMCTLTNVHCFDMVIYAYMCVYIYNDLLIHHTYLRPGVLP
jgi:hypothetical protein